MDRPPPGGPRPAGRLRARSGAGALPRARRLRAPGCRGLLRSRGRGRRGSRGSTTDAARARAAAAGGARRVGIGEVVADARRGVAAAGERHEHWVVLPPFRPGDDPGGALARAFAEAAGRDGEWQEIRDRLAADKGATAIRDLAHDLAVASGQPGASVLVVVDQFDELEAGLVGRMVKEAETPPARAPRCPAGGRPRAGCHRLSLAGCVQALECPGFLPGSCCPTTMPMPRGVLPITRFLRSVGSLAASLWMMAKRSTSSGASPTKLPLHVRRDGMRPSSAARRHGGGGRCSIDWMHSIDRRTTRPIDPMATLARSGPLRLFGAALGVK